jgi:hypothetical protein
MAFFHKDINKRLEKHIAQLKRFGFLPDDSQITRKRISVLEQIDQSLITDIVNLHKQHKEIPDLFANLEHLLFELHQDIEALLHTTTSTEKTSEEIKAVNGLIREILKLLSEEKTKTIDHIKSKIIDITKPGTLIHLMEFKDLVRIWKEGLKRGSAIMLGPCPQLKKEITLKEVLDGSEDLFGFNYGEPYGDKISDGKIKKMGSTQVKKKHLKFVFEELTEAKNRTNDKRLIDYLSYIKSMIKKYSDLEDEDLITDERDRRILNFLSWGESASNPFTGPHIWNLGLVINPEYTEKSKSTVDGRWVMSNMPNESWINPGNPREQILGIYLKSSDLLEMITYKMFKLTRNSIQDRVPIYYPDGSVAYPK